MEREVLLLKKFLRALPTIVLSLILASCNYGLPMFLFTETGVEDRATKALPLFGPNLPQVGYRGKYSFIVLTDSHFGD